ncbi:MAG: hypothetical protein HYX47_21030 [Burkholderiales bacterium]|nr:hypothetical protein [Burkholderiales bacterium]
MKAFRLSLCIVAGLCGAGGALALDAAAALAQVGKPGYLGLNPVRARGNVPCSATALGCDLSDNSVHLYSVPLRGNFWGLDLGYVDAGRVGRAGIGRTQGLNASLVGKAPIAASVGVFGRVGATYARTESLALAAGVPERGFGMSFGAGVSYEFTPRLSATLAWDSQELRLGNAREPVRSTSLGLQYRY